MRQNGRTILTEATKPGVIKAVQMEVIHFHDAKFQNQDGTTGREAVILYTLGEDGIVREFVGGKWMPFPISE